MASVVIIAAAVTSVLLLRVPATVDPAAVEQEIVRTTTQSHGVAPTDVRCPADVPAAVGATLACAGRLDGQPIAFSARQTSDDGRFTVTYDRVLRVADVQRGVQRRVALTRDFAVSVTCGPPGATVLVNPPGVPVPCTVTNLADPADKADVTATVDEHDKLATPFDY